MDSDAGRYIRDTASNHLAYRWEGRVPFREILRLFSEYGAPSELRKCMDKLTEIKPPLAKVEERDDEVFYVFPSVAKEISRRWASELKRFQNQEENLRLQIADLTDKLALMGRLRDSWLEKWSNLGIDGQLKTAIEEQILSFWQRHFLETQRNISGTSEHAQDAREKVASLKSKLESSYEPV